MRPPPTRIALPALAALLLGGCGGAMYKDYDSAYAPQAEYASDADGVPDAYDDVTVTGGYGYGGAGAYHFEEDRIDGELMLEITGEAAGPAPPAEAARSFVPAKKAQLSYEQQSVDAQFKSKSSELPQGKQANLDAAQEGDDKGAKQNDLEEPLVVYTGYLRLRVRRLLEAVDEVTRITEEQHGYVESLTQRVIVVRVPAKDFDQVMAAFGEIGEQLEQRIKALDVTEQFTDLGARLAVAREARARLLKLLEKVEDVEERLRILQEIKRLSEQIESVESTLATLQNLVDFFTITIELEPILDDAATEVHRSPFPWIRNLSPHLTTLYDGKDEFTLALPADFVLFEKDDVYRAQAADTTVIRGGVVDNEPLGDEVYWSNAVHHEMEGRAEELVEEDAAGPMRYRLYRSQDVKPRYYLVAVDVRYEDLYVVEVFYPSEEAYKAHHEAVVKALATFEVQ